MNDKFWMAKIKEETAIRFRFYFLTTAACNFYSAIFTLSISLPLGITFLKYFLPARTLYTASFLFLLFLSQFSFAQNLVINSSFEDTVTCPMGPNQIDRAAGWSSYRYSPDYFNSCDNSLFGVPNNFGGYQNARTGNAYAGFASSVGGANVREYFGTQLTQPLTLGHRYLVSFYLSRGVNNIQGVNMAINKIGAKFSTVAYTAFDPMPIDNIAQIYSDSIISDTLNWVNISGSFIADSSYQYLCIGNFFRDSSTTNISYDSLAYIAYYFVDDISVIDSMLLEEISDSYSIKLVKVFPNPARDWIEIWGNEIESFVLYDVLSRKIITSNQYLVSPIKLNIASYARGIYFLEVKTRNLVINKKIILN